MAPGRQPAQPSAPLAQSVYQAFVRLQSGKPTEASRPAGCFSIRNAVRRHSNGRDNSPSLGTRSRGNARRVTSIYSPSGSMLKLSRKTLPGSYGFFSIRRRAIISAGRASVIRSGRRSVSKERWLPRTWAARSAPAASSPDHDEPNATTEKFADRCEYAVASRAGRRRAEQGWPRHLPHRSPTPSGRSARCPTTGSSTSAQPPR